MLSTQTAGKNFDSAILLMVQKKKLRFRATFDPKKRLSILSKRPFKTLDFFDSDARGSVSSGTPYIVVSCHSESFCAMGR